MARLVIEKGKDKGKVLALDPNGIFLVGRDLKTHLRIRDQQASRRHFKVSTRMGEVRLEDLDSSNGTFVNGERTRSRDLRPGDKIQVGETLIFFLDDESQDEIVVAAPVVAMPADAPPSGPVPRVRKGDLTGREIGGYRIGRLLGRGGMGTVYEAVQLSLDRRVAFKVLSAEYAKDGQFVDRFTAEARAAGRLNHPNIVQVYDVGFASDVRFYSMEFMAGGSVEDVLRRDGRLPPERALPFAFDAARGLEYAERHAIVHRDIKPDNLMLTDDGVVKIGDLGIATRRRAEGEAAEETVSGSPHYMAPEQALGRALDHRADLYALGVSLYQMLSGECPYEGSSAREVILKHLNEPPPPLLSKAPDVPPDVVSLVVRLMEKDPAKRTPSASVLLQDLVPLLRRFPLAQTTKLRIDGVIAQRTELQLAATPTPVSPTADTGPVPAAEKPPLPETQPRTQPTPEEAKAAPPRTLPVGRAGLVRLVVVLLGFALALAGFGVRRAIQERRERARSARQVYLEEARALLASDPQACEKRAKGLIELFDAEGALEEQAEAKKLLDEAGARIAALEEEARLGAAERAFDDVRKQISDFRSPPDDPELVARRELEVKLFDELAQRFEGTRIADRASHEREEARKLLEVARAKKREREERERRAQKAAIALKPAIDACCARGGWDDAIKLASDFERDHGSTAFARTALPVMREQVAAEVRRALGEANARAQAAMKRAAWSEATDAFRPFSDKLRGMPELEAELRRCLDAVEAARRVAEDERKLARAAEDEARARQADEDARSKLDERRFADAAREYELSALSIGSESVKRRLNERADRLKWAAAAIDRLATFVAARRERSGIEHYEPRGSSRVRYVAYDADAKRLRLRQATDPENLLDLELARATHDELHDWILKSSAGHPDCWLDAAAVALEIGDVDHARSDLLRAESEQTLTGEQQAKLARLKAELVR